MLTKPAPNRALFSSTLAAAVVSAVAQFFLIIAYSSCILDKTGNPIGTDYAQRVEEEVEFDAAQQK